MEMTVESMLGSPKFKTNSGIKQTRKESILTRAKRAMLDMEQHRDLGTPIADETADFIAQNDEIRQVRAAIAVLAKGRRPVATEIHAATLSREQLPLGIPLAEKNGQLIVATPRAEWFGFLWGRNPQQRTVTVLPVIPGESKLYSLMTLLWHTVARTMPSFGRRHMTLADAQQTQMADRLKAQIGHIPPANRQEAVQSIVEAMLSGQSVVNLSRFVAPGTAPVADLSTTAAREEQALRSGLGLANHGFMPAAIDPRPPAADIRPIASQGVRRKILKRK